MNEEWIWNEKDKGGCCEEEWKIIEREHKKEIICVDMKTMVEMMTGWRMKKEI